MQVVGRYGVVGARRNADGVLPALLHLNHGAARGERCVALQAGAVDAAALKMTGNLLSKGVAPNAAQQAHLPSQAGGRHRLIGPLASGGKLEIPPLERLSRADKPGHAYADVRIDGANHADGLLAVHGVPSKTAPADAENVT